MTTERPWEVIPVIGTPYVHVMPATGSDEIAHELDEACACGPRLEHQQRADGSDGWIVVHHSLDGREQAECAAGLPPDER